MSWNLWSIASSAQALATQSLDKVYEILEPPKIDSDDETENPELNEQPSASEPVDRSKEKEKEKEPEKAPEAASNEASKGLFSTWNSVIEIGSHLAQDLTNSELVKEGLGYGEAIFQQTLVTLETVGKTTMDTVAAVVDTRDKSGPSSSTPEPLFKFPVAFAKEFEDRAGHAHLMAMESLANECNSKVKTISQTLASNESLLGVKKQIEKDAKTVAAFFNVENASDEIENSKEFQILSDESYAAIQQHLKILDVSSNQLKEFQDLVREVEKLLQDLLLTFRKDLGEVRGEALANEEQVAELTKQTLKKIHAHAMVALAKGTAKTLEQLLRISESLIMKLEKKSEGKPLTPAEVSKSAREIVVFLLKENYCITSIHVKVVEQVSTEAKAHLDKLFEQVEAEESSTTNALYVDIGDAIPFIQDGLQHLHPIVKLMIFEEGFRGTVKPAEVAKAPESPKIPESSQAPESPQKEAEKHEAEEEPKATEAQDEAQEQVTEEAATEEPSD